MVVMCGRFVIAGNKAAIRDAFSVDESFQDELKPSWNVAPMQGIPFVSLPPSICGTTPMT